MVKVNLCENPGMIIIATYFIVNDRRQAEQQSCKVLSQYYLPFSISERGIY